VMLVVAITSNGNAHFHEDRRLPSANSERQRRHLDVNGTRLPTQAVLGSPNSRWGGDPGLNIAGMPAVDITIRYTVPCSFVLLHLEYLVLSGRDHTNPIGMSFFNATISRQ